MTWRVDPTESAVGKGARPVRARINVAVDHVKVIIPATRCQARPVRPTQIAAPTLAAATTNAAQIIAQVIPVPPMTYAAAICCVNG